MDPAPGRCHQKYTSDIAVAARPALTNVLALGDLQYENGALAKFYASYDPAWGRVRDMTKPVPGNHEYGAHGGDFDANATGYFTYFRDQLAAEGPDARRSPAGLVQLRRPGWEHQLAHRRLELRVRGRPGRPGGLGQAIAWSAPSRSSGCERTWPRTRATARSPTGTTPRFSSGSNGDNAIMAPIWNALYEDHADIVLAGHDHNYERLAQAGPTGAREPGRGIRSWVVGTGGKNLTAHSLRSAGQRRTRQHQSRSPEAHAPRSGAGSPAWLVRVGVPRRREVREHVHRLGRGRLRGPPSQPTPRPQPSRSRQPQPQPQSAAPAAARARVLTDARACVGCRVGPHAGR